MACFWHFFMQIIVHMKNLMIVEAHAVRNDENPK